MKRIVSLILCAVLIMGMLPSIAFAATTVASGSCGTNLTWVLDSDGLLTISGSGAMTDYSSIGVVPWFDYADSITSVSLPQGLTTIGQYSFSPCNNLTDVTIPESVTSIQSYAFYSCDSLTSITIPDSVTSIGNDAFRYCTSLTGITIPDSVTSIDDHAFADCDSLTDITIPDSVTRIGISAFEYCSSLTSITIPDSVTTIGGYAFYECSSLSSVTLGNSVTTIGSSAFSYCSGLSSITIPNSVSSIGNSAFSWCGGLTNVSLGSSVTTIGESAFYYCRGLTNIIIPNSVTTIGESAFEGCIGLTSITIPNSVTTIGDEAFRYCEGLTNVTLGNSVTTIAGHAFSSCSSLTRITIPDSVTSIEMYAFSDCEKLSSVTLGKSITSIGAYAFQYCDSLASITIPDSVTSIGYEAFYKCRSLSSVTLGNSVNSIGVGAFHYCTNLTSITIPNSVTVIGGNTFFYCWNLASITIPDNVTSIGSSAFAECQSLRDIYFEGSSPDIGTNAFYNVYATVFFHGANTTWTSGKQQNYGGELTWESVECTPMDVSAIAPTCTEAGMTAGNRCAVCKQIFSGCTEIAALGHNYSYSVTATPSEAAAGKLTGACSRCPEVTEVTLPRLNTTDYTRTVIRNATCTASGSARYTWKDTTYGNFFFDVTISATGHNYTDTVTAPTCTQRGYTTHVCSGCGDTYTDSYVAALGHNWDGGTVTKQPTESETGIKTYQCTRCTETKTETIPVLAHTHNYTSVVTNPTCTQQGYTTYTCACGDTYKSNYTPALNHNYVDGICTRCGAADPGYVPPKPAVDGVTRLAGDGRVETCLEIAVELKERMGVTQFPNVVVASALNFPDALAGSYLAAKMDAPILLTMNSFHVNILGYISANLAPGGTVYILGGTSAVPAGFTDMLTQSNIRWERIAGNDRFGTNLEILNRAGVTTGQTILVCTGTGFADSLSVSATGHPILLVGKTLTASQKDFLNRCGGGRFYIIGGTGAVSETVESELRGYASEVERLAGAGRHETSVLVANEFFPNAESAVIAYSMNFPDGLSGGPLAYNIGAPLILTNSSDTCVNAYTDLKAIDNGYVLGGNGLINDVAVRRIFHMSTADPIN